MSDGYLEAAERAKHDLGKYIAFQVRWMPPDAGVEEWREGLVSDLLHTRRGPAGSEGAVSIWKRLRPSFEGLQDMSEIVAVDEAIAQIVALLPALEAGELSQEDMKSLGETAKLIANRLAALHKRLRGT